MPQKVVLKSNVKERKNHPSKANHNPLAATWLTNGVNIPWIVPTPFITVPVADINEGNIALAILALIKLPIL